MVKVKICGITNHQDAAIAVKLGADAIGFVFAPSPRRIAPEKAREIINELPPFVQTVGVFVNERPDAIRETIRLCSLNLIQLHGDEPPEMCKDFMPHTIKAFRVRDKTVLQSIAPYKGKIRAILFDTYVAQERGGTGRRFDWDLAIMGKGLGVPVILAGGLTPSNIERAILTVKPFAVDVGSGVENRPGEKDHFLIKELMKKIRKIENGGDLNE